MNDFSGWIPMRIYWRDAELMVDWGYLGARRFTEPFFGQTIDACVQRPADLLFRHQTPLDQLGEIVAGHPGARPAGFIFHMSRCGSTLLTQMLAAAPENLVLSEPGPVDHILRSHYQHPGITDGQRVQWLQWLVRALARRRQTDERHLFIKFDCWHTRFLPLIQRAFPGVPWIFVYREPLEVMASQLGHRGAQMIPGVLPPELFGWDLAGVARMELNEYGARALAQICAAALEQVQAGHGKLVNYVQLPALLPTLLADWQIPYSAGALARMQAVASLNAKNPYVPFVADSQTKRETAPAELRAHTQQWLSAVYQQLEAQRPISGFA